MSRSAELARIAAELDRLLDALNANVGALNAIITPGGKEPARG